MTPLRFYDLGPHAGRRGTRLVFFVCWALLTAYVAWHHAVWRDEVRALSFALGGSNLVAMLRGMHGEGHPALWYLMLRGAHTVFGTPKVLQVVAYLVAFAAMLLLTLRSPFRLFVLALILFSRFGLYEFTVMSRNYGISMLLLFLLALAYPQHRRRGVLLGLLLFLLANTNAHSVLLVGSFLVFWLADILLGHRDARKPALKTYAINAAIAIFGCLICAITILPTINDAAQTTPPHGARLIVLVAKSLILSARGFDSLVLTPTVIHWMSTLHLWHTPFRQGAELLQSALLLGSMLGLLRRPAALLGALAALVSFLLFFTVIYAGLFRHHALWLSFLIAMYWIAWSGEPDAPGAAWLTQGPSTRKIRVERLTQAGSLMFVLLLLLQVYSGLRTIAPILLHRTPESRVRDLAALIAGRPDLRDAVVIADPDYLLESLPYYLHNRTFLMHEGRFGNIVIFTRKERLQLSLDDVLREAQILHAQTSQPVIILLETRLQDLPVSSSALSSATPAVIPEGYDWEFRITPEQIRHFQASTDLLQRFGPTSGDNAETFDAYLLR